MLTGLKDKLLRVSSLSPREENPTVPFTNVNPNAGSELLTHYQQQWSEIHQQNEENAASIARIAAQICEMNSKTTRDHGNVAQLMHLLTVPNNIKVSVETCVGQLRELHDTFGAVEKELIALEDVVEDLELERKKSEHKLQLTLYKEKKMGKL